MGAATKTALLVKTRGLRLGRRILTLARRKPLGFIALCIVALMSVAAVFAPLLAPYDPFAILDAPLSAPSRENLFGTDHTARDVLSRTIYGARVSLRIGFSVVVLSAVIGSSLGLVAAYVGRAVDQIIMRLMDVILGFPLLVIALVIVAMLGPSVRNVILALTIVAVPTFARVMRAAALAEQGKTYVEAAKAVGCSHFRIVWRHILPNTIAPLVVIMTSTLSLVILIEATLSFLGLGTPPPTPSWGVMLSGKARTYFEVAPWMVIAPGVALSLTVLGFVLAGDALRDLLDPRLRGTAGPV